MRLSALKLKLKSKIQSVNPVVVLGLAALFVIVFFTLRNTGVYATIMWDEWEYNRFARQLPLGTADVPYYLYYYFYGLTKFCGDGYLGCAQFLNALFYASSMPFLYLVCRRTAPKPWSLFIAVLSVLGATSVYAAHFLPEPMYFFGFWLGAWAILTYVGSKPNLFVLGIGAGSALALLSLVKLHAIFLLPGLMIYLLTCFLLRLIEGGVRKFLVTTALILASFFAIRLSLGFMIAGDAGLNIFGTAYGGRAQSTLTSSGSVIDLAVHAWPFLIGHIMTLAAMYALPLALTSSIQFKPIDPFDRKILSLQLFTWSLLLPLIGVTALYTARVVQLDPDIEGAGGLFRLHLRYYNFLFPLFGILAAAIATHPQKERFNRKKLAGGLIISALGVCFVANLDRFQLSVADGPELRGFATIHIVAYTLCSLGVCSLIVWAWNVKAAARIYLLLFFPLFTLVGAAAAFYSAYKERTPNIYHQAGLFAKDYLKENVSKLAVVGPDYAGVYHAMFYLDNPDITYDNKVPEHSCLTFAPTPQGKEWVLLVGEYHLMSKIDQKIVQPGYTLVHTQPATVQVRPCPKV